MHFLMRWMVMVYFFSKWFIYSWTNILYYQNKNYFNCNYIPFLYEKYKVKNFVHVNKFREEVLLYQRYLILWGPSVIYAPQIIDNTASYYTIISIPWQPVLSHLQFCLQKKKKIEAIWLEAGWFSKSLNSFSFLNHTPIRIVPLSGTRERRDGCSLWKHAMRRLGRGKVRHPISTGVFLGRSTSGKGTEGR